MFSTSPCLVEREKCLFVCYVSSYLDSYLSGDICSYLYSSSKLSSYL